MTESVRAHVYMCVCVRARSTRKTSPLVEGKAGTWEPSSIRAARILPLRHSRRCGMRLMALPPAARVVKQSAQHAAEHVVDVAVHAAHHVLHVLLGGLLDLGGRLRSTHQLRRSPLADLAVGGGGDAAHAGDGRVAAGATGADLHRHLQAVVAQDLGAGD
jgi:hypothetical protein